ncbi:MAG: helix-turn-helix domain-containing protein [Thermoplasmata archaeon]|nr:helix-turn-helix domain-containing protein [Thermoplasmata archaeon]
MKINEKQKRLIAILVRQERWKLREVADLLGITTGRISQILKKVEEKETPKNQKGR